MQTGSQPERARQKHAFSARQSVHAFFFRSITKHESVLPELALDRFDRPAYSLVRKWQESRERHHEQARIERIRSEVLRESFLGLTDPAHANFGMNLVASLPPPSDAIRGPAAAFFHQLNSAVEGHPRHHFGMGEMFGTAADLPDSFVRLAPIRFQKIHQ